MQRPPMKIGVMGSASTSISAEDSQRVDDLAQRLGKKIAAASCVLITGEFDGISGRVVERGELWRVSVATPRNMAGTLPASGV